MLVDTHAHLDFPELGSDLAAVLDRALQNGVREIVSIGIDLKSSRRAVELAKEHPGVYATVGIHPHGAKVLDRDVLDVLRALALHEEVLAIGEVGLDYYRDRQPRPVQCECLRQQLELACEMRLPAVFHVREAYSDFLAIVKDYAHLLVGGVMHCFSGDWNVARQCLDLGFHLSIPGTVTFPKAQMQQDVATRMPGDRLLLETDAPFLAPLPYRGKVNEPSFLIHTARKIAELRQCKVDELGAQSTDNAHRVFKMRNQGPPGALPEG